MTRDRFFSDDPIDGSSEAPDLLSREQYAQHLGVLLDSVRSQSASSVLALIGPWGSGKSSVLAMAVKALKASPNEDGWLVAEFNPWMHSDLESLLLGFFAELRGAMPKDKRWNETRKQIGEFGASVSPLGKLGSIAGVDASGIVKMLGARIAGDTSPSAIKRKAEAALREFGRPILMVLDDLDRLTPPELLRVFKLVRLVGRLPNLYYLLCYDEHTLLDVLGRTDLVANEPRRAQDYLEKMVQIRLDLPALRDTQTGGLVDAGVSSVLAAHRIELAPTQVPRIAQAYHACLKARLTTPRAVNRFFAQLSASITMVRDEVDFVDFMLITFLRTSEPRVYNLLRRYKAPLTGTDGGFSEDRSPDQLAGSWKSRLTGHGVPAEDADGMLELLAVMFVPLEAALRNSSANGVRYEDVLRRRGVGHADYFDRYFSFGVPEEDIADSTVLEALGQLRSDEAGDALLRLKTRLVEDTARVTRKIAILWSAKQAPVGAVLELLAEAYEKVPETPDLFLEDPGRSLVVLGRELLAEAQSDETVDLLRRLSTTDRRLQFASRTVDPVRHIQADNAKAATPPWQLSARDTIRELIKERLNQAADPESLRQLPDVAFNLVWLWGRIDLPSLKAWLTERMDSSTWPLIDVLPRLVAVGRPLGSDSARTVIGDFNAGEVDQIIGLDYVFERLADEISEVHTTVGPFTPNPTMQDRRDYALKVLRDVRSRIAGTVHSDETAD